METKTYKSPVVGGNIMLIVKNMEEIKLEDSPVEEPIEEPTKVETPEEETPEEEPKTEPEEAV